MKLKKALQNLGAQESISLAQRLAFGLGIDWDGGIGVVFQAIVDNPKRVPRIGRKRDDEEAALEKWLLKYQKGQRKRASRRISNPPGTIADPIIETIIGARIDHLSAADQHKITHAHRLSMSAENILGLLLEEYLADNLHDYGWYCAWGETVKSVDFVHEDGNLLQIKNRSNSENSSSRSIRKGTKITKWYRIKATRIKYMWNSLNRICGTTHLSEAAFVGFVGRTLVDNPACLAVEKDNPWASLLS